jgi:hypothetical protein
MDEAKGALILRISMLFFGFGVFGVGSVWDGVLDMGIYTCRPPLLLTTFLV